jgi:transposase
MYTKDQTAQRDSAIIALRVAHGLSNKDIAKVLSVSTTTIYYVLKRNKVIGASTVKLLGVAAKCHA